MTMILALAGKRGVGKTTSALFMARRHGFIRKSFAEPLRQISKQIFNFSDSDFEVANKERKFMLYDWTPREFLIRLGGLIRFHDKDYFVNAALRDMNTKDDLVFDDCRFPEEANKIRYFGGKVVLIKRYASLNPFSSPLDDITETSMDNYKFDYIIEDSANTSLGSLYSALTTMLITLKNGV